MAGTMSRVSAFLRSPQGRRLTERAKEAARKPRNRRRIQELRERYAGSRRRRA